MGFLKKIFLPKKCSSPPALQTDSDRRKALRIEDDSIILNDTGVRKRDSSPPFTALIKEEITQRKSDVPEEKRAHSVVELQRTSEAEPWGLVLLSGGGWGAGTACPRIAHLPPGSLAHRSDMLSQGDVLTSVNGISTRGMRVDDVTALVESAKTKLVLDVEYEIPPARAPRPTFVKYKVWTPDGRSKKASLSSSTTTTTTTAASHLLPLFLYHRQQHSSRLSK